jgi:zinc transport system substrate-binding protein
VQGKPFVVFHDAYGYFTSHYGLTQTGSIALGDAAAPGAGRLQELRAQMTGGNIVCAFPEAQHDPKLVQTLVEGTAVKVGPTLDPSGSSMDPGPGLYAALLGGLAENLRACLAD